jgi:hypothetical protein
MDKYFKYKNKYLTLKNIDNLFNNKFIYYMRLPKNKLNKNIYKYINKKLKNHNQFMHVIFI